VAQFILGNAIGKTAEKHKSLQQLLWRIDFAVVWLLIKMFGLLPIDTASKLGRHLGQLIGPRLKRKHELYRENLSRAFPEMSAQEIDTLIKNSWGAAGRVLAEYPHFEAIFNSKDRQRIHLQLSDQFTNPNDSLRPVVFVTAHHCNWEMAPSALNRLNIPTANLYSPPTNPLLNTLLYESRRKMNCELVDKNNPARAMIKFLKKGRSVGIVIDRRVDGGPAVPFFGLPKPTSMLPAKLALKFGIDLIPVRVQRLQGAEFKVSLLAPVTPDQDSAGATEDELALDMMTQVHQHFQQWICEEPEEWFCPKRIWPKTAARLTPNVGDTEVTTHAA
jgi:KDO2-lipid IV(A) lauroyltransferase